MKVTLVIFATFFLAIGFGSKPVLAVDDDLILGIFGGVNTIIDFILRTYFNAINNILLFLFKSLLNLITSEVPGDTQINLATLVPKLRSLKKLTLETFVAELLTTLGDHENLTLKIIPESIGRTKINLHYLLKTAAPLLHGKTITLANLRFALANYLSKYIYSIVVPS